MSGHTPGPWALSINSASIAAAAVGTVVYGNPDNPNRLADARLIAAAPDLLEALKRLSAVFHSMGPTGDELLFNAHQAIARAEGK